MSDAPGSGGLYFLAPGEERVVAVPAGPAADLLAAFVDLLPEPLGLVYVLLRSGTFRPEGRYLARRPLGRAEVQALLARSGRFLSEDGRHGLVVYSATESAAATLDRRGVVEGHGPVERFVAALQARGLAEGAPPEPAAHPIAEENMAEEQALLSALEWSWNALEPGDELL